MTKMTEKWTEWARKQSYPRVGFMLNVLCCTSLVCVFLLLLVEGAALLWLRGWKVFVLGLAFFFAAVTFQAVADDPYYGPVINGVPFGPQPDGSGAGGGYNGDGSRTFYTADYSAFFNWDPNTGAWSTLPNNGSDYVGLSGTSNPWDGSNWASDGPGWSADDFTSSTPTPTPGGVDDMAEPVFGLMDVVTELVIAVLLAVLVGGAFFVFWKFIVRAMRS